MVIDCDRCEARGLACGNCAVTVIVGQGVGQGAGAGAGEGAGAGAGEGAELGPAEPRALTVLANAGMIPPLRYAPRMAKAS